MGVYFKGDFKNLNKFKSGVYNKVTDWLEDFESGSFSDEWIINDSSFEIMTDKAYKGSYSSGIQKSSTNFIDVASVIPTLLKGGVKISLFEFYYNENQNSNGGGIRLYDNNNNFILGLVTDNPEWVVDDNNGINTLYGGDGYDRWVYVSVTFDWNNETFDVHWEDLQSGTTKNETGYILGNNTNVEKIKFSNYGAGYTNNKDMKMRFDNIYAKI